MLNPWVRNGSVLPVHLYAFVIKIWEVNFQRCSNEASKGASREPGQGVVFELCGRWGDCIFQDSSVMGENVYIYI